MRFASLSIVVAVLVSAGAVLSGCGAESSQQPRADVTISASSSFKEVLEEELIPAYRRTAHGKGLDFAVSTGPSAAQSEAAATGEAPDILLLSTMPDMDALVDARLVRPDWRSGEFGDLFAVSMVALLVPPGNPRRIRGWDDLRRRDLRVLVSDPRVFDDGEWAAMALWGSREFAADGPRRGRRFLNRVLGSAEIERGGPEAAIRRLASGRADVMVGYESDAIQAEAAGLEVEHVVPEATLIVEHPAAETVHASRAAQRFLRFIRTARVQRLLAEQGLRPASVAAQRATQNRFPDPGMYTVTVLHGWEEVEPRFFAPGTGAVPQLLSGTPPR